MSRGRQRPGNIQEIVKQKERVHLANEKQKQKETRERLKREKEIEREQIKNAKEKSKNFEFQKIEEEKQYLINQINSESQILNAFNLIEGGETTLYYLRLVFKGKRYYKIGITFHNVRERYNKNDFKIIDKILYEKKLTHAKTIEQKIINHFKKYIFPLSILSSGDSEIFDVDILQLDIDEGNND